MDLSILSPIEALALTIYGEARGESVEGQIAVANVVMNRLLRSKQYKTIQDVCFAPEQFSCWNETDPNRVILLELAEHLVLGDYTDMSLRQAVYIATGVINHSFIDNVKGSRYYLTATRYNSNRPNWAMNPTNVEKIGNHIFFDV